MLRVHCSITQFDEQYNAREYRRVCCLTEDNRIEEKGTELMPTATLGNNKEQQQQQQQQQNPAKKHERKEKVNSRDKGTSTLNCQLQTSMQ